MSIFLEVTTHLLLKSTIFKEWKIPTGWKWLNWVKTKIKIIDTVVVILSFVWSPIESQEANSEPQSLCIDKFYYCNLNYAELYRSTNAHIIVHGLVLAWQWSAIRKAKTYNRIELNRSL